MLFKDAIEAVRESHKDACVDRDIFDARLTAIASLHSPDDNTTCEECGKAHPCPTLRACDEGELPAFAREFGFTQ